MCGHVFLRREGEARGRVGVEMNDMGRVSRGCKSGVCLKVVVVVVVERGRGEGGFGFENFEN